MTSESPKPTATAPDSADVISGPIGGASLRDPATSGPEGADLAKLPAIDAPVGEPQQAAPIPRSDDSTSGPAVDHTAAKAEAGLPSRS